jgi:hypothetical protein
LLFQQTSAYLNYTSHTFITTRLLAFCGETLGQTTRDFDVLTFLKDVLSYVFHFCINDITHGLIAGFINIPEPNRDLGNS